MFGKGFFKAPASDPAAIVQACGSARRVLLCMIDLHIGNFAVSTPAIRSLQRGFDGKADVVVAASLVPVAQRLLDPTTIIGHATPGTIVGDVRGVLRSRRRMRRGYDLMLCISGGIRASTLARFSGVPVTVGVDKYRRSGLYTHRIEDRNPAHIMDRYAQFGICANGAAPIIEAYAPSAEDQESLRSILDEAGADADRPLTIIHAGAGKANRRWPAERFAQIADHAIEQHGHQIGILRAPGEEAEAEGVLATMRHQSNARLLSLPLGMLLPLFDHAEMLVCNESGPMHLASMTRCAIVAMYGPTDPARWSPIRTGEDVIVLRHRPDPTTNEPIRVDSIQASTVIEAMDKALAAGNHLNAALPSPFSGSTSGAESPPART